MAVQCIYLLDAVMAVKGGGACMLT
jgi:hypothetical protein